MASHTSSLSANAQPAASSAAVPSRNRWQPIAVLAVFAALALRLLFLVSRYAVNVFFMDQWDFNDATLFQRHSLWEMFRWQHGPHRQGLGAIAAYLFEPLFHWNTRVESFVVWGVIVLAALCALWLKWRLFGELSVWDVCVPLILFSPLQYETLVITANFAHGPLPLLLILLYCLAWTCSRASLRYGLVLLLNFVAIHTGFAFFLGLITPVALAADYFLHRRLVPRGALLFGISFAASLASLALFFVGYKFETSVDCPPNLFQSPAAYLRFLLLSFANLFGAKGSGIVPTLAGALILAAMLTALLVSFMNVTQKHKLAISWTAAILLSFCLLFVANAAYGRSCLGPEVAQVSRYIIYMECGLLGLYFFLLSLPESLFRRATLLVLAAALAGTVPLRAEDTAVLRFVSAAKSNWRACYLEHEDIPGCNHAVGYGVYPVVTPQLKAKLDFLKHSTLNLYSGKPSSGQRDAGQK